MNHNTIVSVDARTLPDAIVLLRGAIKLFNENKAIENIEVTLDSRHGKAKIKSFDRQIGLNAATKMLARLTDAPKVTGLVYCAIEVNSFNDSNYIEQLHNI